MSGLFATPASGGPLPSTPARPDNGIRPLVDYGYLSSVSSEQRTVRAAHQVYEHLINLWAPSIIEAAYELGLFTALSECSRTAEELSVALGSDQRATRVLLNGLLAYGLVERTGRGSGARYTLPTEYRQTLLPGGLYSMVGKILHDRHLAWDSWRRLADAVRDVPRVRVTQEPQANAVFAAVPVDVREALWADGYKFYVWDESTDEVRWMCSWDTTEADVDAFATAVAKYAG